MIPRKIFAFFILHSLTAAPLLAQETELNPVTVTATLNPVAASQTGRNLVVVRGEQFANLPVHSIDDLLRFLPGVEVQARGPMGAQSDFTIRGGTFQQVLVIVDGIRLNDPNTGHFSSYIPIAPSEIERIEILKGASSAIYGSDAVGGVIHIITKTFAAQSTAAADARKFETKLLAGEYRFVHGSLGAFIRSRGTAVAVGYHTNQTDGQAMRGARGFLDLHTASVSISRQLNPHWQLALRTAYDHRSFGAQNFYTTALSDTAVEKVKSFWNQLRLSFRKNKNRFSLSAGYKNVDDMFRFNPRTTANQNRSRLLQSIAVLEHNISSRTAFTTGLQWQNRSINSNDRGRHAIWQGAAFGVLQQEIGKGFVVSPALRYDWDERSGAELIPQVNLSWKLAEFQLRGSAGKTIRQADFTERYNNYNRTLVPNGNRVGDPDLEAERSFSWEAGLDVLAGSAVKISATWFRRNHKDLIDYVATPYADMPRKENLLSNGNYFLAKNIAAIQTSGFETDIHFNKDFGSLRLFALAGALWLQTKDNVPPSLYISSHANFLTNFSCRVETGRLAFSTSGLYKQRDPQRAAALGATLTKDYFLLNTRAEAMLIKNKCSILLQVDNLLDRAYSDLLGANMPGRWLMAGARLSL